MTFDLAQAEELAEGGREAGVVFAVTHNYTGYPLVRQAREMVLGGELGEINAIRVVLHPGLAAHAARKRDQKQAAWRTDPAKQRRGRLLRRHRHARLQPRPLHDRLASRTNLAAALRCSAGPQARRLRPRRRSVSKTAPSARSPPARSATAGKTTCSSKWTARKARSQWRQEEPNQMMVRRNGEPPAIYTRNPRPVHERGGQGGLPAAGRPSRGVFRGVRQHLRAAYDEMVLRAAGKKFERRPPSIRTSTTASRGCTSSSNRSPAAPKGRLAAAEARPGQALSAQASRNKPDARARDAGR